MHKDIYTGHFSTMVRVNTRTDKPFNDPHKRKATFSIHAVHRTKHLTIQNDFRRKIVLFCFPVTHSSNRMGENGNTTKLYLYLKHIGEENFWLKTKSKTTYSQCVHGHGAKTPCLHTKVEYRLRCFRFGFLFDNNWYKWCDTVNEHEHAKRAKKIWIQMHFVALRANGKIGKQKHRKLCVIYLYSWIHSSLCSLHLFCFVSVRVFSSSVTNLVFPSKIFNRTYGYAVSDLWILSLHTETPAREWENQNRSCNCSVLTAGVPVLTISSVNLSDYIWMNWTKNYQTCSNLRLKHFTKESEQPTEKKKLLNVRERGGGKLFQLT